MRVKLNIKKIFYKTKIIEKKTKKRKINVCQTKNLEVKAKNLLKKRFFFVATEADNNFEVIMQGNFHLPQSPTR